MTEPEAEQALAPSVSDAKPVSDAVSDGATRTALWRSRQDPEALKQRNREAVQRWRAKARAKAAE